MSKLPFVTNTDEPMPMRWWIAMAAVNLAMACLSVARVMSGEGIAKPLVGILATVVLSAAPLFGREWARTRRELSKVE